MSDPATLSKEEAIALLQRTRRHLIDEGRRIAFELCLAHGTTHSQAVLAELERIGLLDGLAISDHWLGAVFHCEMFRWTGEVVAVEASGLNLIRGGKQRNIHRRYVKLWMIAP